MSVRHSLLCVVITVVLLGLSSKLEPVSAQVSAADSAAVLLQAASRFAGEGEPDVAEALYRFIVANFPGTPSAREAAAYLDAVRTGGTAGSGRVELQVWATTYGLWLGVAVPGAFGADDPEPYGVGLLAGGPIGFLSGKALARSLDLTEGQARAITLGGSWGTWQGFGWAKVLDIGVDEVCFDDPFGGYCYDEGDSSQETFAAMILGGLAGIATGAALSNRTIPPGVATAVNFGALWGTWFGFGGGYLADLEDDGLLAATLLGGNAGLMTMALAAPGWNVSRSRARIVSIYGVIGALSGLGLDLIIQPDDDKTAIAIPLAGSVAGLALGVANTGGYDVPDTGSGAAPPGGSLVRLTDGEWSLGAPLPLPRLVPWEGPGPGSWRTALSFELLRASF